MEQVTRGRYFRKDAVGSENVIQNLGVQVLRTYSVCLVPLMKGLTLQVDIGSRIIRTENCL